MSTEYADRITKEILAKVNGQNKLAEQAIKTLLKRDPAFLQSLVSPYIDGIVLHAVERARKPAGSRNASAPTRASVPMPQVQRKKSAPLQPMPAKGLDSMMAAWAKSFEKDAPPPLPEGKKVSATHIAAMQALIKKK